MARAVEPEALSHVDVEQRRVLESSVADVRVGGTARHSNAVVAKQAAVKCVVVIVETETG